MCAQPAGSGRPRIRKQAVSILNKWVYVMKKISAVALNLVWFVELQEITHGVGTGA